MPSKDVGSYKGRPDVKKTRSLVRRYLRFGNRSAEDVRTYLRNRNIPDHVIEDTIGFFVQEGMLDDFVIAKLLATEMERKCYSIGSIRQRLIDKGIQKTLVEKAIEPVKKNGDESIARRFIEGIQLPHATRSSKYKKTAQIYRKLRQRGFDEELIEKINPEFQKD